MLLALVVAALPVVSGCGGGSSSSAPETTGTTSTSQVEAQAGAGSKQKAHTQQNKAPEGSNEGEGSGAGKQGAGKQGAKVPQPQGEPEPGISPEQRAKATKANMTLESPSLVRNDGYHLELPPASTCDGKNAPPTLRWTGVPSSAKELILFALNLKPVDNALFFDWAVAGLDPNLTEIEDGKLPPGAVVGKNSLGKPGYSICAPKGETYVFMLYAIPTMLSPKPGFDPLALREAAVKQSGNSGFLATSYNVY